MSVRVAIVCSDLLFRVRLRDVVLAAGAEPAAPNATESLGAAVVDLGETRSDPLAAIRALRAAHPALVILGFAPHVRGDQLDGGREAGCSEVVPRSRVAETLARLLEANIAGHQSD